MFHLKVCLNDPIHLQITTANRTCSEAMPWGAFPQTRISTPDVPEPLESFNRPEAAGRVNPLANG